MASDIDKALFYQVTHSAGVLAVIADRFYPVNLPQKVLTFPAAVYQAIAGEQIHTHREATALPKQRYQVTCWGINFEDMVAADKAIKTAIDGKRGSWGTGTYVTSVQSCTVQSEPRDDRDPITGLYTRSRDYFIRYK